MKKGIFRFLISLNILLFSIESFSQDFERRSLKSIQFLQKGEVSELVLMFEDGVAEAKKFHIKDDRQIIVDLENTTASERTMRAFDTSEFSGSIVFVSAYQRPDRPQDIRIAIQLRENVRSLMSQRDNKIMLQVENRFGVFTQTKVEDDYIANKDAGGGKVLGKLLVPKSNSIEDILDNLSLSGRKKYIGKRITLNIRDVSVEDTLKMIAEASGFNIILSSEVKGLKNLTLNLTNTPWDQALDTILSLNKLVAKKNGNILMIQSYETAANDREEELLAKQAAKNREILVTKIFPISYASTKELMIILQEYLTKDRGKISEDIRTNSLIIKDTPIVMDKIKKIVETLDLQTPQVLIEAKIVEVSEGYSKEIGLENGLSFGYDPIGSIGSRVPSTVGEDPTAGIDSGPGFAFSSAPTSEGDAAGTAFGFTVSRFGRLTNLNFNLQLLESESKGKVLSSPKVITQNRKKATLTATNTDAYQVTSGTGENATTSFEEVQAALTLDVTPQVTNEGSIILEINVAKEDFGRRTFAAGPPTRTGNSVITTVLVENGSTIVLGGLYEYRNEESHSGIPFLKDIPLIGWLFRTPYNPSVSKREVIIFLTPRIINQEEAGLVNKG